MLQELTDRQKFILTIVIHEYIKTATPIGSQHLVENYHLDMSSATVRNEMAALTELGYLRQPHTSAGRVPSEEGYRYFVSRLMQNAELPDTTRRTISHQFYQMRHDVEQWMKLAASVLAHQSQAASLVTAPHPDQMRLKHVELISTRGRQTLMVLVMMGGEIHQRILTLTEVVGQEQLSQAAEHISILCQGMNVEQIKAVTGQMSVFEQDMMEYVVLQMNEAGAVFAGEVYLDGLTNVLAEPEFSGSEESRRALRLLQEPSMLEDLLSRTVATSSVGGVQVLIGGEGSWDDLRQCSIVLARYGSPGLATGTLGVLGPMRMSYGRTISAIRFLSGLLSEMVTDSLID
jgi:heat-inducible transcriptional repressor